MTIEQAITQRHMVRKYIDRPLAADLVLALEQRITQNNAAHALDLTLVVGNDDGVGGMAKLLLTHSVYNYIILAGKDAPADKQAVSLDERLGYCGADLILYAQTLGLNTWWCGGMFNAKGAAKHLAKAGLRVNGIIAVGYGQTQGVPHRSKTAAQVSRYNGDAPQWFTNGVEALLCAPTALNKQAYLVTGEGNKVTLTCDSGHFADIDLGIGKYHFEIGAGKENFEWA